MDIYPVEKIVADLNMSLKIYKQVANRLDDCRKKLAGVVTAYTDHPHAWRVGCHREVVDEEFYEINDGDDYLPLFRLQSEDMHYIAVSILAGERTVIADIKVAIHDHDVPAARGTGEMVGDVIDTIEKVYYLYKECTEREICLLGIPDGDVFEDSLGVLQVRFAAVRDLIARTAVAHQVIFTLAYQIEEQLETLRGEYEDENPPPDAFADCEASANCV